MSSQQSGLQFKEIIYTKKDGIAKIVINRPERLNAFTTLTINEMIKAFTDSWLDKTVGVIVLTGTGNRAFCTGGDQSTRESGGYAADEAGLIPMADGHSFVIQLIRIIPKPVIAMVNGYAIGGGHVLHVVCDLSIASETARFGQVGPRVGSFDAGFGSAYLSRLVGEKKAREIWFMCRQYTAQEALQMGLVNRVVPPDKLEEETNNWCRELLDKSPSSLGALKASFNADTDSIMGIHRMANPLLQYYYGTEESMEGRNAFLEKRKPDYSKFRK